jgi:predicted neuraminidase
MAKPVQLRTCRLCGRADKAGDSAYCLLIKYSVRHYVHAVCLAKKLGTKAALESLPAREHDCFVFAVRRAELHDGREILKRDREIERKRRQATRRLEAQRQSTDTVAAAPMEAG